MGTYPNNVKVFFLEPTDRELMFLRRYSYPRRCSKREDWGCDAKIAFGEADIRYSKTTDGSTIIESRSELKPAKDDPRWPKIYSTCQEEFKDEDNRQLFTEQIYIRSDTQEKTTIRSAPVGACWNAFWIADHKTKKGSGYIVGPDGRSLIVRCPDGHDWMVDSRCSNCTRPEDNDHFCWVRTGRPEDGTLDVGKGGNTCAAGAGSIQTKNWHGFLRNGVLCE